MARVASHGHGNGLSDAGVGLGLNNPCSSSKFAKRLILFFGNLYLCFDHTLDLMACLNYFKLAWVEKQARQLA